MAKVTITLEDRPGNGLAVKVAFDPPIDASLPEEPASASGAMATVMLDAMRDAIKSTRKSCDPQ